MFRIFVVLISVFCCFIWGDWKNWRMYYPTILYFIIWDMIYNFIFFNHTLWMYSGLVNHTFSTLLIAFTVFPCTTMVYLPHIPKKLWQQVAYIFFWVFLYSVIEFISYLMKTFEYDNNWNIWWSAGFNTVMFLMLWLHHKKPLIVWPISVALFSLAMYIFKIPFDKIK
ncbi:hypothetical protein DFR58_105160 [Anaerobacterium chartisolvens]|uniref:Uncharacterized protein n=1 Tax=Anaerobacterium chartisolvens TaxID=1297424 RepID=A0A369BCU1_9FIRM|nr:CBO0543 family protein [Anaerobacterium chartisolvens]RCX18396.1 hypothetical protein DFR58_105160 [Anaerobacterium chartisolvens]